MAHIVDTRAHGGDFVVIGKTMVLPHSSEAVVNGAEPLVASLRWNPTANRLEAYLPNGSGWRWEAIGVNRGNRSVVYSTGATMTGNIVMTSGSIYADSGIPAAPSISFDAKRGTGLSIDQFGNLRASVNTDLIITAEADKVTIHGELIVDEFNVGTISADDARYDALSANTIQVARVVTTDDFTANSSTIRDLEANEITLIPTTASDPNMITELTMTTAGTDWVIAHQKNHDLTFTVAGREVLALTQDGKLRYEDEYETDQIFLADAAYPVGTVVVVGGADEITVTTTVASTKVAGVVEFTQANRQLALAKGRRIGCRVAGPVAKGDLLVTSATPGCAAAASGDVPVGALVGIALSASTGSTGFIDVRLP